MQELFLPKENFSSLVSRLIGLGRVVAPVAFQGHNILEDISADNIDQINLEGFRTVESFKAYLFRLTEKVAAYFSADEPTHPQKLVFLGARGCDLEALEVLDRVLGEGEFQEAQYQANRANVFLVGADCTACGQTCFCEMVGGKPYPQKNFDLNLTPVKGGYLIEVGSPAGEKFINEARGLVMDASAGQKEQRIALRQQMEERLAEQNKDFSCRCTIEWAEAHRANLENQKCWKSVTKNCVECGACNFACPTCSCFLLLDQKEGEGYGRYKIWDGCLKAGYARVAGGSNSRPKLFERLQNRYHCKFDYSYDRLGRYTCVGCGRCIDGCAGKIDMRQVYGELAKQVPLTAKLA